MDMQQLSPQMYDTLVERKRTLEKHYEAEKLSLRQLCSDEKDTINGPRVDAEAQIERLWIDIVKLGLFLDNVTIVEDDSALEVVAVGKKVFVRIHGCDCEEEPDELEVIIDGFCDGCRDGVQVITPSSPIGAAIIGAKPGDERKLVLPKGLSRIVVVSIQNS